MCNSIVDELSNKLMIRMNIVSRGKVVSHKWFTINGRSLGFAPKKVALHKYVDDVISFVKPTCFSYIN